MATSLIRRLNGGAGYKRPLFAGALASKTSVDDARERREALFLAAAAAAAVSTASLGVFPDDKVRLEASAAASPGPAARGNFRPADAPRNVMLHRMRSVRARALQEKYQIDWETTLGEGAYGSVYPGRLASTGEKIALKKIAKRYTNRSAFKSETDALLRIWDNGGHPNISGLRDMYEDASHYYLILDLVSGGEMFDHLIQYGAYSEADAARLMREVASALAFLHGIGVVHADLKPENLLLCSKKVWDGTIKIIDFGCSRVSMAQKYQSADHLTHLQDLEELSKRFEKEASKNNASPDPDSSNLRAVRDAMAHSAAVLSSSSAVAPAADGEAMINDEDLSVGTTAYWPPERFQKGAKATSAMDMWSTGVILYIMLTGAHPFDTSGRLGDKEIEKKIVADPTPPIGPPLTSHLSKSAIDLIQKLMDPDPTKRLDAYGMMMHPWIRGETARTEKIEGSADKLSKFKEVRDRFEQAVLWALVESSGQDDNISEIIRPKHREDTQYSDSHLMKRAFEVFDKAGKGYVSPDDIGRVVTQVTGQEVSDSDRKDMLEVAGEAGYDENYDPGLTLAVFSDLFANLRYEHYKKGEYIFRAGDDGDSMYFITSGKAEVLTRKGQLVSLLRHGEFLGEGAILEKVNKRFATIRAATPLDVIKISTKDFDRYAKSSSSPALKHSLKVKHKAGLLRNAKNLIRLQTNLTTRIMHKGDIIYKEGDIGEFMYQVDETDGGELDVFHGDEKVHVYRNGESFGESSLLLKRPRSSTVVCASDTCKVHVMNADDFLEVIESSPELGGSLRDMCRKRMFKKAVKRFARERQHAFTMAGLERAFHDADKDKSGTLNLDELRSLFHAMDPDYPEEDIVAFLNFLDFDEDGRIEMDEFRRIFRVFDS